MNPTGNFHLNSSQTHKKSYVLIAAGSGITPIISIAKSVLNDEPDSDVILFYGNKGFGSIIFREEIEGLKNKFMNRLRVVHILSRESLGNSIQKGRIDSDKLKKLHKAFLENTTIDNLRSFINLSNTSKSVSLYRVANIIKSDFTYCLFI